MARRVMPPDEILALLTATPARLAALTANLDDAELRSAPVPGEWSANEVLAHLRSCADVWGGCIAAMLAADHPTLRAINPLSWIERTDYLELEFEPSLRAFTSQRSELLALLEPLPASSWSRSATVTGAGAPLERTVHSYAERLARHERPHVRQVEALVAAVRG